MTAVVSRHLDYLWEQHNKATRRWLLFMSAIGCESCHLPHQILRQ